MSKLLRAALLLTILGAFFSAQVQSTKAAGVIDIENITATPDVTSFTVQWTTAVPASSIVNYGLTTDYGTSTTEADTTPRVTQHSVTVTGLVTCTTYHFTVTSNALSYAETTATSADQQVTTAGCAAVAGATAVAATATPDATLVNTGDNTPIYLTGIGSLLMIIFTISRLKKAGY